jgi:glycosyltransferase involved in cell wall biosynthesis
MSNTFNGKKGRKRTIEDRLISGLNSVRYLLAEPFLLRIARVRHEREYVNAKASPLVSVQINTFNRGQLLIERAIPSVLSQTYGNLELVIIGNHCTDNTEELVSKIDDPRVRFYNLPSHYPKDIDDMESRWLIGAGEAGNIGLNLLRGQWFTMLGDDDIYTPDCIEVLLRFAQEGKYEFVSAQYEAERFGKRRIVDGIRAKDAYFTRRQPRPDDNSPKIGGIQTWMYRSYLRFFKYNGNSWRKSWNRASDLDFCLRIYRSGVRMGFLDRVVAYVLPRPGEATVGFDAYRLNPTY